MIKYIVLFIIILPFSLHQTLSPNCFNCLNGTCTSTGCQQCASGFMLSSQGWCGIFTPIQGCIIYDYLYTNRCINCSTDRMLIDSRCYIKPQNCQVSDKNQQCLTCQSNFILVRGNCYTQDIENCPPGSLPAQGFCQPLPAQNCQRPQGICDSCITGYTLINGRCLRVNSTLPCPSHTCSCTNGFIFSSTCYQIQIDQCTIYRDPVYCSACSPTFVAITGICLVPVKQDDINCNVIAPLSDYCTGCNQNYFLNIDAFCQRNFNLTTCPLSTGLFHLQNGFCAYNDIRCDQIDQANNTYLCLWCQEGFTLINGFCQRIICTQYGKNGLCTQAFTGYAIVGANQFVKMPANCLTISPGTTNCMQCTNFTKNVSMVLGSTGNYVCAYYDQNCIQYDSNGSCIQCANQTADDGYILLNRFCFKKADNCQQRNPTDLSQCLQCNIGYHLDASNSHCYINVTGCDVYLTGSDCKQCTAQTYVLFTKKCYPVNTDCLDYNSDNTCRKCSQGLMPFQSICVYYHPFCIQYGPDQVCSRTASGWTLGNGMTDDQKSYYRNFMLAGQNVASSNASVSLGGLDGGNGSGSYSTGALITNFPYANVIGNKVASVNILGQVISCNPGYTLVNKICVKKVIPFCQQYSPDQICIQCQPQYTLMGNFTCASGLHCATANDVSNGRCLACQSGYILIGVQCFYLDVQATIDQWLLSSSFFKYTLSDGSYLAWPLMSNCINQINPDTCSQCSSPFQNVQGYCEMPINQCADYGFNDGVVPGLCQTCQTGYTLWLGQCIKLVCSQISSNGLCLSCPINYYYYFGVCLSTQQQNCRIYQNGTCQLCNYGYYVSSQGPCQSIVNGCLTTNPDTGRCLQCRCLMTLYLEKCVTTINYCVDYDANNKCKNCQQNTVNRTQLMNDGTCALLQGQCATVDQTSKLCNSCNLGYTLIQQNGLMLCVNLKSNCTLYDTLGRCTACNQSYVLQNNQCKIYIQYCLGYTADQLTCTLCAPGTVLSNGCCKIQDPYCSTYSFCACTGCSNGYYLSSSGICQQNPIGCDIYDFVNNKCLKCSNFYYLILDGTCVYSDSITNGCLQGYNMTHDQSVSYQCSKCIQGFQLNLNDNLCYGFNCLAYVESTRNCLTCPLYYKIYNPNSPTDTLSYCIPYFCDLYTPGQSTCLKNSSFYAGGHSIITSDNTIIIIYCLSVDSTTGICSSCTNYRYPNPNTQYHLCYPSHCLNSSQFMCTQCEIGYGLDSAYPGSCIPQFCSQISPNNTCLSCILPYNLTDMGICVNTGCCEIYDNISNICTTAKKYFILQNSVCEAGNCQKFDTIKTYLCTQCSSGYTLTIDGTCRPSNCQQETATGNSCMLCNPGFIISMNINAICIPNYCDKISQDLNSCLQCQDGFTLNKDQLCQANYCLNYLPSLVCQTCIPYFTLTQIGTCIANCKIGNVTQCQCCNSGFSLNQTSGLCEPTINYCISNDSTTNQCNQCLSGYNLVSGQCIYPIPHCMTPSLLGCLTCTPGYQLVNNCTCTPLYCQQQNPDGSCAQCHPRTELTSQGACQPRDCQFFSKDTWTCTGCYSQFTLSNGICITHNCSEWVDIQNTTCKVCNSLQNSQIPAFNLVYGACYLQYCKDDPRNSLCSTCIPGYSLTSSGTCSCQNYDNINNICICPLGYIYDSNNGCTINTNPCLSHDQNGNCIQCPIYYQNPLINGGECIPLYCAKWYFPSLHYAQCTTCYPNFVLTNGFCSSSFCFQFANQTGNSLPQCLECTIGYTPVNNYCIPTFCDEKTYDLPNAKCQICTQFGYIVTADQKSCVIANCDDFTPPSTCNQCKIGYEIISEICQVRNCSVFNGLNCVTCVQGFILNNSLCIAYGCSKFDSNLYCTQCNDGFILSQAYTCKRVYCDIDSQQKCIQCIPGYSYLPTYQQCVSSNCQIYMPNYQGCDTCLPGYYKQNGTCVDIYCNLNSFNSAFICQQCRDGYSFNTNGLCYPTNPGNCSLGQYFNTSIGSCINIPVDNCQIYMNQVCLWCLPGFVLLNNLCYSFEFCTSYSYFYGCYQCIPGYYLDGLLCKKYTQDPNCIQYANYLCLQCKQGYKLFNSICILIPQNCKDVDNNGNCYNCIDGYMLTNGLCHIKDNNCLNYNNQGNCAQCLSGYYINASGICVAYPNNCTNVNVNGICIQCTTGFALQDGLCFKQYPFCTTYSPTTNLCTQCTQNFTLVNNTCICASDSQLILNQFCIKLPPNCLMINQTSYACTFCASGYALQNGLCFKQYPFCSIYSPTTSLCTQCIQNFTLVNNSCTCGSDSQLLLNQFCIKLPQNCLTINPISFSCSSCSQGFILTSSFTCVLVDSNCHTYDPQTGICTDCLSNYILVNKTCVPCPPNQIKVNNQCFPSVPGCNNYLSNGQCSSCMSGYQLSNGTCITISPPAFCSVYDPITGKCQQCIANYQPSPDGSSCSLINCLTPSADKKSCLVCASGYILSSGFCYPQISYCQSYSQITGVCTNCTSGYFPSADGKLCMLLNCQQMDPTGKSCLQCLPSFQWDGKNCVYQTDFCSSYSNGYCSICPPLTILTNHRCVPTNCLSYNYSTGICLTCVSGYTLYNKLCYLTIQYCISYGQTGLCTQCQNGYNLLNNGTLCQNLIPNCFVEVNNSICSRCMYRYYQNQKICSPFLPYCINIDPLGNCISCCFGSTLVNGTCVRDTVIQFCSQQVGSACHQCLPNYSYCSFCESCLPVTPNCLSYSASGSCLQCFDNFYLQNGVCISTPVGYVTKALGTCRSNYYQSGQNCYRNEADLMLYSAFSKTTTTTTTTTTTSYIQGGATILPSTTSSSSSSSSSSTSTSPSSTSSSYVVKSNSNPLIIFGIVIKTTGTLPQTSSFLLYYRSKQNDPFICWNSCIPTKIDTINFVKDLVYPIIATEINVYLINQIQQNVSIDFKLLK